MSHPTEKCWKEFGKPGWVLVAAGMKLRSAPLNVFAPLIPVAPATAATPSDNFKTAVSPTELAYLHASRASTMHTLPLASMSLALLANRLASYAGGDTPTPGTSALITSHDISWVIDSGASAHMMGTPSILTSYHPDSSIPNIHIADGRPCPVCGYGTSQATATLPLHNVLYVPGFPTKLLSISAITKPLNCRVFFYPYHCIFQDPSTRKRIGLGRENGHGLYELVANSPSVGLRVLFSLFASSCSSHTSFLWHCQCGHPSFSKIKEILPWLRLCDYKCESCEVGKHHRSTYLVCTGIPSKCPFDLVHCDVWGLAQHASPSRGRYYIVFVDDY